MKMQYSARLIAMCSMMMRGILVMGLLLGSKDQALAQQTVETAEILPAAENIIPPTPALLSIRAAMNKSAEASVSSGVIMVGVRIKKIAQVDNLDLLGDQADFWANVHIKSPSKDTSMASPTWENQDVVEPNWTVMSAAKKGEPVYISISVGEREWPSGSTEIDVSPSGERAFTINLIAEGGKAYTYTKEGNEGPAFLKEGIRARIDLEITMEDMFIQMAKDGKRVLGSLADITNYFAPGTNWLKSPWGGWGKMMQDALSVNVESAMIQLTFYVAASGLLTPVSLAAGHVAPEIAKEIIKFIFEQYVDFYAKEYRMTKPTGALYLGTSPQTELLNTTCQLNQILLDMSKLYDAEISSYDQESKLANALNNDIDKLSEAATKAEFIYKKIENLIGMNFVVYQTIEGRKYYSSETGKPSRDVFYMVYRTLKNELALKQKILKGIAPDIQVTSLTFTPATPASGQVATFTLQMKNQGLSPAAGNRYSDYTIFVDGVPVVKKPADAALPALQPGQAQSFSFQHTFISAGSHTIRAVAEADNDVLEISETNNERSVVLVVDLPDIRVKSVTFSPAIPVVNTTEVNFAVTVENVGKAQAAGIGYSNFTAWDGTTSIHTEPGDLATPPLDPGKTWTTSFTHVFASTGAHTIRVAADPEKHVAEISDANNEKSVVVNVSAPPDLRVKSLTASPVEPAAKYDKAVFTAIVENAGGSPAAAAGYSSYAVQVGEDKVLYQPGGSSLPPLAAGATWTTTFSYTFPAGGLQTVRFGTDPDAKVVETSETNNDKTISINVLPPPPDLVVEAFTCTPSRDWSFNGKGMVSVSVKIKNTGVGPADASGYAAYDILADGVPIVKARKSAGLAPLAPGNTWTDNNAYTFTDGKSAHHLVLKVDPENNVREISEANNDKTTDIRMAIETVVAPATPLLPDIKVVSMTITPATPKQREAATLTVVVENAGKWVCTDDRYGSYKLYINGGLVTQQLAGSGAGPLAAGKRWTTTIPCVFTNAGPNTVRIEMDPENKVNEMDETNNTFIITLKVIEKPVVPDSIN